MPSAIITGVTGFVGSNLAVDLIKNGWDIVGTYQNQKNLYKISEIVNSLSLIQDTHGGVFAIKKTLKNREIDVIFHLAAQTSHVFSLDNPLEDLRINVHPLLQILELIKENSLHKRPYLVFTSSKGVIGTPNYLPVDENHPCNPEDPYSLNKWYNEKLLDLYYRKYEINSTILRLTNVYGPKQQIMSSQKGFINYFIGLGLQKKEIQVFGDGEQERDISYISDVVKALELAGTKQLTKSNILFLGTGLGVTIRKIADLISELTGTNVNFRAFPPEFKKIEVGNFIVNNSRAATLLGWKPSIKWVEGIKKTVDFYKKNFQEYSKVDN